MKLHLSLLVILILFSVLTLTTGEISLPVVLEGVKTRWSSQSPEWNALLDERLPRLIVILCTGASLAVSGLIMQSLFQNPLASPSVLGISCGGSLFVIIVFALGWHQTQPYAVSLAAFLGSLLTLIVVYSISSIQGKLHIQSLVLTGIAISTLLLAIQGAITYSLRDQWQLIQTITEWEAGSTTDRSWKHVHMQLPLTLVGLFGCWFYTKEINILALGDEEAKNLGVEVKQVRWRLFLCIALLTGGAIAAIGIIAFFGLVMPHVLRRAVGPNVKKLFPLCILAGSATLTTLDLLLRQLSIQAFSIGNISAILGGLFFILLLFKSKKNYLVTSC